jgi:biopolymer transport protein ExbD
MDVEINLVPFIDLLSCCICFLLISAVWTQVARIDVKPAPNLPADSPPPDEPAIKLTVTIKPSGYTLSDGASSLELARAAGVYPVADLSSKLELVRQAHPEITAVTLMSEDTVPYRDLVQVMDICLQRGLEDISLAGA